MVMGSRFGGRGIGDNGALSNIHKVRTIARRCLNGQPGLAKMLSFLYFLSIDSFRRAQRDHAPRAFSE